MTVPHALCAYCGHRGPGHRCEHCGAPLRAVAEAGRIVAAAGRAGAAVGETVASAERVTGAAVEAAAGAAGGARVWQWRAALASVAILAVFAVLLVRWSVPKLPAPTDRAAATVMLPPPLHAAAVCRPAEGEESARRCVVAAADPLLSGGIAADRDLVFTLRTAEPDRLSGDLRRWRASGATVVADGAVFAAIGAGATVWYADTRSGTRIDTAAFADRASARTFLARSGLLR